MKWAGKLSGAVVKGVKTAPKKTAGAAISVKDNFVEGYREVAGEKKSEDVITMDV